MVAHRTWHFYTARIVSAHGVRYQWTWRASCEKQEVAAADQSFLTLYECVADAKRNGFTGDADPNSGFRVGDHRDAGMLITRQEQG